MVALDRSWRCGRFADVLARTGRAARPSGSIETKR